LIFSCAMVHTSLSFRQNSSGDITAAFARRAPNASLNGATNERALLGQVVLKIFPTVI
jgi:hypothetical protein